ncbi:MAG: division/cell wall cluster transcriptional repressor MraZ [Luteitalea sp.]|nr:division/cell wall cluster transcriptional repressor MraZ [Luteitalea sp.]
MSLRGSIKARIDDKGRLKVPTVFRAAVEQDHGTGLYITSLNSTGNHVRIYPLPVWEEIEAKLNSMSTTHPVRNKFLKVTSFYGQVAELDSQGRVLIHPRLREAAAMVGDVDVVGALNHLQVWNYERLLAEIHAEPLTDTELGDLPI